MITITRSKPFYVVAGAGDLAVKTAARSPPASAPRRIERKDLRKAVVDPAGRDRGPPGEGADRRRRCRRGRRGPRGRRLHRAADPRPQGRRPDPSPAGDPGPEEGRATTVRRRRQPPRPRRSGRRHADHRQAGGHQRHPPRGQRKGATSTRKRAPRARRPPRRRPRARPPRPPRPVPRRSAADDNAASQLLDRPRRPVPTRRGRAVAAVRLASWNIVGRASRASSC